MKHLKKNRKFGRTADFRKSFLWNMVNDLVLKERLKTAEARAKEIKPIIEKVITRAMTDNLANRRLLLRNLSKKSVKKLFKDISPGFIGRSGGYTRIIKSETRKNDGSKMVIIEMVK